MEIILLILLLVSFGINIFLLVKKENKPEKPIEKKPKLTREEKDKQEQIKKAFDNLMNYDETTARRRK